MSADGGRRGVPHGKAVWLFVSLGNVQVGVREVEDCRGLRVDNADLIE